MNEIVERKETLPEKIQETYKHIIINRERIKAFQAQLRAIDKADLGKEIYDQKLEEAQDEGINLLFAMARLGDLLKELVGRYDTTYVGNKKPPKKEISLPKGINKDNAYRLRKKSDYQWLLPEVIERVLKRKNIPLPKDWEKAIKIQEQLKKADERKDSVIPTDSKVKTGDFREIGSDFVAENSVDIIFTDPPYAENAIELYEGLALFASQVLRPSGICMSYSGHAFLPEVYIAMKEHLDYMWTFAIRHTGGELRFRKFHIRNAWKPIVAFYKPPLDLWWDWFSDITSGGKEKENHEWQQAELEAIHYIKALCPEGGLIVDPMCGSGTSLIAAKCLGMNYIGFEVNSETADKARKRLGEI